MSFNNVNFSHVINNNYQSPTDINQNPGFDLSSRHIRTAKKVDLRHSFAGFYYLYTVTNALDLSSNGKNQTKKVRQHDVVNQYLTPKFQNLAISKNKAPRGSHHGFNRGDGGRGVSPWKN